MLDMLFGGVGVGMGFILIIVLIALFFERPLWWFMAPSIFFFGTMSISMLLYGRSSVDEKKRIDSFTARPAFYVIITIILCVIAFLVKDYNTKDVLFLIVQLVEKYL